MDTQNNKSQFRSKYFDDYRTFDAQYASEMLDSLDSEFLNKYSTLAKRNYKRFYELALSAHQQLRKNKSLDLTTVFNEEEFNSIPQNSDQVSDKWQVKFLSLPE